MASEYKKAWEILKRTKSITILLNSALSEKTIKDAITEKKKDDPNKDPKERIKTERVVRPDGRIQIVFTLVTSIRKSNEFFDL
jgi:hypothetical protein